MDELNATLPEGHASPEEIKNTMLSGLDFAPAAMFLSTAPSSRSRASIRCSAATELMSPFRMDSADQSKH